ncbi:MAG: lipopolysaccharide biosynthesis protein [Cyanobacteria bacterium]|nr:lipopolysaccharide biosynthesis protein [Cyanobacteriota bacterium]
MGYTSDAFSGTSWMSTYKVFYRVISFLRIAILARLLSPSQFGLFGIATLVLSFLEILTETGVNIVLVQVKEKVEDFIDSAWVVSIFRGILLFLIVLLSAPFVADFFNTPKALEIIMLISLVPLIRGFINPSEVKLQKELKFKYEFVFRSSIFLVDSLVAIFFIIFTHSVYGLVLGLLAGAMFELIVSFVFIKPTPKFKFKKHYISDILQRGKWVTSYGVLGYFADQGDNIAVGKLLGASSLGIYQMIYKISILPLSEIADGVNKVVFPIYVKIADDKERLKKAFLKTTIIVSALAASLGTIIFLFPKEIILIVLGDKWLLGAETLRVLSLYGILHAIGGSISSLFLALKKQKYVTIMSFFRFTILAITIVPLVIKFGIIGAGYAVLLSVFGEIPVVVYLTYKIFKKDK